MFQTQRMSDRLSLAARAVLTEEGIPVGSFPQAVLPSANHPSLPQAAHLPLLWPTFVPSMPTITLNSLKFPVVLKDTPAYRLLLPYNPALLLSLLLPLLLPPPSPAP